MCFFATSYSVIYLTFSLQLVDVTSWFLPDPWMRNIPFDSIDFKLPFLTKNKSNLYTPSFHEIQAELCNHPLDLKSPSFRSTPLPVRVEKIHCYMSGSKTKHQKIIDFWVTQIDPQFRFCSFYLFMARAQRKEHDSSTQSSTPALSPQPPTYRIATPPLPLPHPNPFTTASHTTTQKHSIDSTTPTPNPSP